MAILLKKNVTIPVTDAEEFIRERLKKGDTTSFLFIVPTKRKLRDLQREFLTAVPSGTTPAVYLFTLETLASHLFTLICAPKRIVAGPTQAVLVNEAIRSVQSNLRYFHLSDSAHTIPKGTFQKILDVINYLKDKGAYPSTLYAEIESADASERWKLQDILTIYEAYENILGDTFIDAAGMLKQLNAEWDTPRMAPMFTSHFKSVDTILVSGFDEFSDPEMTFLYHLSGNEQVGTIVSFDYQPGNDELFGHLANNYQKFIHMGFEECKVPNPKSGEFSRHIANHLFQYNSNSPQLPASEYVTVRQVTDRQEEVNTIAKIIKRLALQTPDRDLSKICVAMYRPQLYTNLFREAFQRYGIPANITDRFALDQSPLVISILALLAVRQNNFRLIDIQRALSSAYFDLSHDGSPVRPGNLAEVAAALKVTAGYTTWMNRLEQRRKLIGEELNICADEFEELRLQREEHSLQEAKKDLAYLANLLRRFEKPMTPVEFRRHLLAMLDELRTMEGIVKIHSRALAEDLLEKDSRAYQKFLIFLDEFLDILEFERSEPLRQPVSYYLERLKTTMSQVRYNLRQQYGYGVYVTSFEETRGLQFDVMIIAGMVDGEFPPPYQPNTFLTPSRRLRQEGYHLTEHRYLCYQALTNFTEHLYVTHPMKDGEMELVPSSFLSAIRKVIDVQEVRGNDNTDLDNTIYSPVEMLGHLGKFAGSSSGEYMEAFLPHLDDELRATFNHMRHAITVEKSRLGGKSLPEYDGVIGSRLDKESKAKLERFRANVFSVSQLESYGRCPFQYFGDRVLRLNVASTAEEQLSPIERGGLLHELLFEFYVQRRERNLKPLFETTEEEFRQATEELLALASRKIDELYVPDIFWEVDKELLLGTATRKGALQEFLETEKNRKLEVTPSFFEATFGPHVGNKKASDPKFDYEKPVTAGAVQLRGKVDRIELGSGKFTIIDYKTGSIIAKRREIDLGMSLQLPVYLYAVERILAEKTGRAMNGVAGIYYNLKPPVKEELGIGSSEHKDKAFISKRSSHQLLQSDEELKAVINRAIGFVNDYVDKIARGEFPVAPKIPETICTYCDFRSICRIQASIALPREGVS